MYGNPFGAVSQDECQSKLEVPLEMQEGQNFSSLFCKDFMIFSKGDVNSIRMIRTVLTEFQDLSSLYPNPNKSDIFLSGSLNVEREQILRILGFREGELPMKYLGVPLISSRLKAVYYRASWIESPLKFNIGLVEHSHTQDEYS
jgi:hypothetical protein